MSSNEEHELKHLGFIENIGVELLVILSSIYAFFKDNSRCLKTTVVSVESEVVYVAGPATNKIKDVSEDSLFFVDDKLDKYAPTFLLDLIDKLGPTVTETIPSVEKLFDPLVDKTKALLESGFSTAESLVGEGIEVVKGLPLMDKLLPIFEKDPADLANQAIDTTKNVVGGIPIIGDTAQSIINKPLDMTGDFINSASNSIKENGLTGAISSATQQAVDNVTQAGSDLANSALDTTKSVVGGIPIIGGTAESILTSQTDKASEIINSTTSSIKENGIFGSIGSLTQQTIDSVSTATSDLANSALDTTKSVVGGIPIIGGTAESIITTQTDKASEIINSTTSSIKENGIVGTITNAGSDMANSALDTTKSVVGGIPIVGGIMVGTTETETDSDTDTAANEAEDDTTTKKKKKKKSGGLFGALISTTEDVLDTTQKTTSAVTGWFGF